MQRESLANMMADVTIHLIFCTWENPTTLVQSSIVNEVEGRRLNKPSNDPYTATTRAVAV